MLKFVAEVAKETAEKSGNETTWFVEPLNALVAALIGALVTLAVNGWWRYRNRAEPDWHVTLSGYGRGEKSDYGEESGYRIFGSVSNVGDGVAHRVSLASSGGSNIRFSERIASGGVSPIMMLGGSEALDGIIPLGTWDDCELTLEWTTPPTHKRKRKQYTFKPGEYMDRPGERYTDPETGVVSLKYFEDI